MMVPEKKTCQTLLFNAQKKNKKQLLRKSWKKKKLEEKGKLSCARWTNKCYKKSPTLTVETSATCF